MLSLNTNMTSLIVQKNLAAATKGLNSALEKLTSGFKINHAKDDPANYAVMKNIQAKLSSWEVAENNMMIGSCMLETASSNAELIQNHITRIRDLCEQSVNGTYGEDSIKAIKSEISSRLEEINRIRRSTDFNGIKLFGELSENGDIIPKTINIQVGIDSSSSSRIGIDTSLALPDLNDFENLDITNPNILDRIDGALSELSIYQVKIAASSNRLEYAMDSAEVTTRNLTSSLSTIRDADIAKVSSDFVKFQIMQQACATLLATANQMPALALQLL